MKERFIAFVEPEIFGIMDTETKEIISSGTKSIQTSPEEIVELQKGLQKLGKLI